MNGIIFDIKKFALHDGNGIRLTIFLKGCPLKCWWCHNPESQNIGIENYQLIKKLDGKEIKVSENVGKTYTLSELMAIIQKEQIFFEESGGGVTFSGGEPLQQSVFLKHALIQTKIKEIHTAVDTCGFAATKNFMDIIQFTDLFLFDIKHLSDTEHLKFTGVSNKTILQNLTFLSKYHRNVFVRFPVIPSLNDTKEHLENLFQFLKGIIQNGGIKRLDLLPYHKIAENKYIKYNKENLMPKISEPSVERMAELQKYFSKLNIEVTVGG